MLLDPSANLTVEWGRGGPCQETSAPSVSDDHNRLCAAPPRGGLTVTRLPAVMLRALTGWPRPAFCYGNRESRGPFPCGDNKNPSRYWRVRAKRGSPARTRGAEAC